MIPLPGSTPDVVPWGRTCLCRDKTDGALYLLDLLDDRVRNEAANAGVFAELDDVSWLSIVHRNLAPLRWVIPVPTPVANAWEGSHATNVPVGLAWQLGGARDPVPETVLAKSRYWNGSLLTPMLADFLQQACDALQSIHRSETPPGDPSLIPAHNLFRGDALFITADNRLVIAGHGLAPLLHLTRPGNLRMALESPVCAPFAPPEILGGGCGSGTLAGDIYSLGALIFYIGTNRAYDPSGDRSMGDDSRMPIEETLAECLRPTPAQRPTSMERVLRRFDLARDAEGRPANIPFAKASARISSGAGPDARDESNPAVRVAAVEGNVPGGWLMRRFEVRVAQADVPHAVESGHALSPKGLLIPGGRYIQGLRRGDADERPEREIFLSAFYIAETAVTNEDLRAFLDEQGNADARWYRESKYSYVMLKGLLRRRYAVQPGFEKHPANNLTHAGALALAAWIAGKTGLPWRLPTEAEWEAAARYKRVPGEPYPWGKDYPSPLHARYGRLWAEEKYLVTVPVTALERGRSGCGALNLAGNVWEWCQDWYARDAYANGPEADPKGPAHGNFRVARGGCWLSTAHELRCTNRRGEPPEPEAALGMGLRLVMTAPEAVTESATFDTMARPESGVAIAG